MKKVYLPQLKSIQIDNFSLYYQEPSFRFDFRDGISAIIGGNGIGKTTFVEIIIYCLVGFKRVYTKKKLTKLNTNYFRVRMDDSFQQERNQMASAQLTFRIQESEVTICRSLWEDKILWLSIDGEIFEDINEEHYEKIIINITKLYKFEFFEKIIREFLFFDEERKNVAWEPETQDSILRILFFEESFFKKFETLEKEFIQLDTKARHKSEDSRVEQESLDQLMNEKKQLLSESNVSSDRGEQLAFLFETKNTLEQERTELQSETELLLDQHKETKDKLDLLYGERDVIVQKIESLESEISQVETKLFDSIYKKLPDYYLTIERSAISDGRCLICDTHDKHIKERAIEYKKLDKCLVCSSHFVEETSFDPETIDNLNILQKEKDVLQNQIENKNAEIVKIEQQVTNINNSLNRCNIRLDEIYKQFIHLDTLISEHNKEQPDDTYSQIIKVKQNRIEQLKRERDDFYAQSKKMKTELDYLHKEFSGLLTKLNKKLSSYFNKYATEFIGLECELTVKEKIVNRVPHVTYMPKINGSRREEIWSVSESQRFFLDQAFRMAIMDYLQSNIEGFQTFFITETPEGSLDIAYEEQAAKMFLLFAESSNNIIFTSNLNSSRFLVKLFQSVLGDDKKSRTLNLLEKGKMTDVQIRNRKEINFILENVFGGEVK